MIREASGLLPSSPTKSTCIEAGVLPFDYLVTDIISKRAIFYAERSKTDCSKNLLIETANNIFRRHTGSRLPKVLPFIKLLDRRWNDPVPQIDWRLKRILSTADSPTKVQVEYLSFVRKNYESHLKFFTDGSKASNSVGFGVHGPDVTASFRLPNCCSVYSAEVAALKLAVEAAIPLDVPVIIFTDSASALQALESGTSRHPWIQSIESSTTRNITFCWIPGHKGIRGNEEADRLANLGRTSQRHRTKVPSGDIKKHITLSIKQAWSIAWSNNTSLFLRKVKGITHKWDDREKRKEQRVLSRLRVGHTKLTHAHYTGNTREPPECVPCQCRMTVEHTLVFCQVYENYRTTVNLSGSIRDILANDRSTEEKLLIFLRESDLFDKI